MLELLIAILLLVAVAAWISVPLRSRGAPVEPGLEPSAEVKSFGELNADTLSLSEVASHRKEASEMVDRVGLDDGPSS